MVEGRESTKLTRVIDYVDDSALVFRVAWYTVASKAGVYLADYSEPEGASFEGRAKFSANINSDSMEVGVVVKESDGTLSIDVSGPDQDKVHSLLDEITNSLNGSLDKYRVLETDDQGKVRRALVAKACWDRLVLLILKKKSISDIYYQVAHGREMMIKATEGQDIHPIALSTSGWLANIEKLPREESMPANLATALAKKSIEWKRDTVEVIQNFI
ncbi:MAG: hypothetical protein ACFFEF_11610 [Candidatus Thorarchaeota archaeon]